MIVLIIIIRQPYLNPSNLPTSSSAKSYLLLLDQGGTVKAGNSTRGTEEDLEMLTSGFADCTLTEVRDKCWLFVAEALHVIDLMQQKSQYGQEYGYAYEQFT